MEEARIAQKWLDQRKKKLQETRDKLKKSKSPGQRSQSNKRKKSPMQIVYRPLTAIPSTSEGPKTSTSRRSVEYNKAKKKKVSKREDTSRQSDLAGQPHNYKTQRTASDRSS